MTYLGSKRGMGFFFGGSAPTFVVSAHEIFFCGGGDGSGKL